MNAMRRKALWDTRARLEDINEGLIKVKAELYQIREEEQDAYDNLPESLQESSRGEVMQEAIDKIEEIIDGLDEIDLDYLMDSIEEVANI